MLVKFIGTLRTTREIPDITESTLSCGNLSLYFYFSVHCGVTRANDTLLPTTLAWEVTQSPPSVHPSVRQFVSTLWNRLIFDLKVY